MGPNLNFYAAKHHLTVHLAFIRERYVFGLAGKHVKSWKLRSLDSRPASILHAFCMCLGSVVQPMLIPRSRRQDPIHYAKCFVEPVLSRGIGIFTTIHFLQVRHLNVRLSIPAAKLNLNLFAAVSWILSSSGRHSPFYLSPVPGASMKKR